MKRLCILFTAIALVACGEDSIEPTPEPKPDPEIPKTEDKITYSGENSIVVSSGAAEASLSFSATVDWTVSSSESWCRVSPEKGTAGTADVKASIDANESADDRTATVTIKAGKAEKKLTVTQMPGENIVDDSAIRAGLIALYEATGGDNWYNNTNWCSEKPISEWHGIYHRVMEDGGTLVVDLTDNNLVGTVPAEFWGCADFYSVIFNMNPNLSGTLPEDLGRHKNLQLLMTMLSNFSGEIPKSIGECTELRRLELGECNYSGHIPEELGNCRNLYYLALHYNNFSGKIPGSLRNCTEMTDFYVFNNQLSGDLSTVFDLADSWTKLNPYGIDISENQFTGNIPDEFSRYMDRVLIPQNYFYGDIPESVTGHEDWGKIWLHIIKQNVTSGGNRLNMDGVVIPGPDFSVSDMDGNHIDSAAEYAKNKLTVLFEWASWCSFSQEIAAIFKSEYDNYRNNGVDIIGWNIMEHMEADAVEYVSENEIPWRNLKYGTQLYRLGWTPFVVVVDSNGEIVFEEVTRDRYDVFGFIDKYIAGNDGGSGGDIEDMPVRPW